MLRSPRITVFEPSESRRTVASLLSRRIDKNRATGSRIAPGDSASTPSTWVRIETSRSVALSAAPDWSTSIFTFWRIGFGLRAGATAATVCRASRSFSRSHVIFMAERGE